VKSAVVFLLALGLTITSLAQSPPPTPIPLEFFGIHMSEGASTFLTPVPPPIVVGAGGKGAATNWPYLEPARGTYDWAGLDAVTIFNQQTGRPVFEGYQEQPLWTVSDTTACYAATAGVESCPAPPTDVFTSAACQAPLSGTTTTNCQFKEFVTSMVSRYKHTGVQTGCTSANPQCHGVIAMYEFWNEPPYALGPGHCAIGTSCMPLASFVQMASDWYYTIKGIDPQALVCSPALSLVPNHPSYTQFMSSFLSSGGAAIPFDCWDFHINEPTPEAQIADISTYTGLLSANGISNPLMHATEAGRWSVGNCNAIAAADEQAYIGRIELIYWSNNVKAHYWYAYSSCAPLSNLPTSSTLTPLGVAYGNVESWMVGSTMTSACGPSGSFWTCGLTLANGHKALVVWNPVFQSDATATYEPASQYTRWHDLNGNTGVVSAAMEIGESPILFEAAGGGQTPDFTISASPATITVTAAGQSGTTTLTITPLGGFNQSLSYSCSGLPSEATCSFTAVSATSETLTIGTAAPSAKLQLRPGQSDRLCLAMLVPGLFGLLVLPAVNWKRSLHAVRLLTIIAILTYSVFLTVGCAGFSNSGASGNPGNPGTPIGNSSVVVTATTGGSNPISNKITVLLTVQ